ncbi:Hypothetical predicted protein [Podarcis lilfordi]|uniref:Uncharacterized protein n=1 Tax=Podarcis lilfordi TaxID=74358 RepID=A0AA35LKR3_9SAUR|nr:Hypothetical predicted protein [Podarcis lilfordi]
MSWKDPFITITFPSKVIYTIGSILMLIIHTGVLIGDLYHFFVSQRGDLMSFHFTVVLLREAHQSIEMIPLSHFSIIEDKSLLLLLFGFCSPHIQPASTGHCWQRSTLYKQTTMC